MKNVLLLLVGSIVALLLLTVAVPRTQRNLFIPVATPTPVSSVQLIIDFGDSKKTYTVASSNTAYQALVEAAAQDNTIVLIKQYDFGVFVEKIGDFSSTAKQAWIYFVNGASGDVAADKKELKVGDIVEWKYVKPQ